MLFRPCSLYRKDPQTSKKRKREFLKGTIQSYQHDFIALKSNSNCLKQIECELLCHGKAPSIATNSKHPAEGKTNSFNYKFT